MSEEKVPNKATSHLSEDEKQQLYKNARAKAWYEGIWQTVGKCVFCDLKDKYILHEENGVVLTINIYPYIDGQLMAIPRRHVASPKELTEIEWETMRKFNYIAKKIIRKTHGHKGMWTLMREGGPEAQMSVSDHLHAQFIPFDNSDLCTWNYRELKNTPLENVDLYKKEYKEIIKTAEKFDLKYKQQNTFPINSDLVIFNSKKEVLFEERKLEFKLSPDYITLPGGHLNDSNNSLILELIREVKEETNFEAKEEFIKLYDSKLSKITYKLQSKHLMSNYSKHETMLWNIYVYKKLVDKSVLKPGDDCESFIWVKIEDVASHPRISDEAKETLTKIINDLKNDKLRLE